MHRNGNAGLIDTGLTDETVLFIKERIDLDTLFCDTDVIEQPHIVPLPQGAAVNVDLAAAF